MSLSEAPQLSGLGFSDPKIWQEISRAIGAMQSIVWSDPLIKDDLTRAEGVRYLTRLIAGALPMSLDSSSADYPQFLHFLSTRIHYGLPATDCYYIWAPVHGDNVYHIKGDRGTARLFDIETRQGHFAHIAQWETIDRKSDFEIGDDNQIDIVLSREPQPGNWVKLPEGDGNIIFRQYYYDWNTERPADVTIERVGATFPPPALTEKDIADRCQLFVDWLQYLPERFAQVYQSYHEAPEDKLIFDSINFGWEDLRYGKGTYQCAEDEALIMEVTLPKAEYWSTQLCSHFWEARDYHLRQTSLNGHQAEVGEDGVFRAVISHRDPGVANWLDAGGQDRGLISIRYYKADSTPVPTIKRVKFSDLEKELPASTPRVSAEQRQDILRDRARSVVRRNCE
ncbi:Protein of unknown function (DUF1214) [Spongiibacter sp. IMCC21906]|jgi:hypothetical protein|uniref:DUF1214 domain-containing protein n=1 Tax=Spongiibacter sp. IMCC21906 TaxID=1620392 RepID=UPI00062DD7B8|nr:DUF1214 domain-containing protein [Spongiibacter sp. IMCC21906]AKH69300.1 Protein of unknown function (DUF1214) [Spongiibacter sp. IMCC21906]